MSSSSDIDILPISLNFPDLLTVPEAAEIMRVNVEEMQGLIDQKIIPCLSLWDKTLIPRTALENFLANLCRSSYTHNTPTVTAECENLENSICDCEPCQKGNDDMASKSKINQPVIINGVKHWIRANTMQEFTDKILSHLSHQLVRTPACHAGLFSDYAWNWYYTYSKPTVETATAVTYKRQLSLYIIPAFEGLCIEEITVDHVQRLFNNISGAKSTKDKVKLVLNQIFDSAVEDKLLSQNPLKSKKLRITGSASKATVPYSIEQMRYLVQHIGDIKDPTDRAYMAIQALHPLRLEEVLGLQPADIDIENMVIHVRRAVTHPTRNQPEIKETKTDSSLRTIGLSSLALPYLVDYTDGPFFLGGSKPLSYTQVRRMCERIKKDTNFSETITPIRFRTTVLTDLYNQTKDIKLAQAAAGHTTSAMTLKYYVKGREDSSRAAAAVDQAYAG